MSGGLFLFITTSYGVRSFTCGQWIGDGWCHRGRKNPCWGENDVIFYDPWHSYVVNQPPPMVILVSGMSRAIQRVSNQWNRSKTRSARSSKALVRPNSTGQYNPDREELLPPLPPVLHDPSSDFLQTKANLFSWMVPSSHLITALIAHLCSTVWMHWRYLMGGKVHFCTRKNGVYNSSPILLQFS